MMKDELAAIRSRIDSLDRRAAALLARRFALARAMARKGLKKKVTDKAREKSVLANAAAAAEPAFRPALRSVYAEIIRQSKKIQHADKI